MTNNTDIDNPVFAVCNNCGHRKSAFLIFRDNDLFSTYGQPSMVSMLNIRHRLKCVECGAKDAKLETKTSKVNPLYVATTESAERVFHKPTCGWMKHVSLANEIRFDSRESAIKRGYSPCKYCHP